MLLLFVKGVESVVSVVRSEGDGIERVIYDSLVATSWRGSRAGAFDVTLGRGLVFDREARASREKKLLGRIIVMYCDLYLSVLIWYMRFDRFQHSFLIVMKCVL